MYLNCDHRYVKLNLDPPIGEVFYVQNISQKIRKLFPSEEIDPLSTDELSDFLYNVILDILENGDIDIDDVEEVIFDGPYKIGDPRPGETECYLLDISFYDQMNEEIYAELGEKRSQLDKLKLKYDNDRKKILTGCHREVARVLWNHAN